MTDVAHLRIDGEGYRLFWARWNEVLPSAEDDRQLIWAQSDRDGLVYAETVDELMGKIGFKNKSSTNGGDI